MKIVPFFILCILLVNGCAGDAPRDNPLDPQASGFPQKGSVTGRILIAGVSVGIADATVTSLTEKVSVQTDALGYFTFPTLSAGIHSFVCIKTNFTTDTFAVIVQSGETEEIFRNLNSAPVTTFKQILTRKIDQFWPGPLYSAEISAIVSDPNGVTDLDSVWFGVEALRFPLTYSYSTKTFVASIDSFPTNTIDWLVGKPLYIVSKDVSNAVNISDAFYVTRVIENESTPISPTPTNQPNVTADSLIFHWTPPNVLFNYTNTITVYRSGTDAIVWKYTGLISFYEELQYPNDGSIALLSQGNYYWTVTVVDDFGNYSRSKEYSFVVK